MHSKTSRCHVPDLSMQLDGDTDDNGNFDRYDMKNRMT